MIPEYKFQVGGNNNIGRWDNILPNYMTDIVNVILQAKQEMSFLQIKITHFLLSKMYKIVHNSREIAGISRFLDISFADAAFFQLICEYCIHGSTIIVRQKNTEKIIFFKGLKTSIKLLQKMFIFLNVISGTKKRFKVLTIAGYTGYLCVFHPDTALMSIEYNASIHNLTLFQVVIRYCFNKWTPGQLLRYISEEDDISKIGNHTYNAK